MLRHRRAVTHTITAEIENYEHHRKTAPAVQKSGRISAILDRAQGPLLDLFKDIGLMPKELKYYGINDFLQAPDKIMESDKDWNLVN